MGGIYSSARESFLTAGINWSTDTFGALLATGGYTPNLGLDQHVADIPGPAISGRQPLTSLSSNAGGAYAADVNFSSVVGAAVVYIIIYKNTGSDATSPLICLIDSANGLPVFPSGTPVTISWDAINGIFIV